MKKIEAILEEWKSIAKDFEQACKATLNPAPMEEAVANETFKDLKSIYLDLQYKEDEVLDEVGAFLQYRTLKGKFEKEV